MSQRKLDTRLTHLLKLYREAAHDVYLYVTNKWPSGSNISYEYRGKRQTSEVIYHDIDNRCVVVQGDKQQKLRVPYTRIKDQRKRLK